MFTAVVTLLCIGVVAWGSYWTNPYNQATRFRDPYQAGVDPNTDQVILTQTYPLRATTSGYKRLFALAKSGWHIFLASQREERGIDSTRETEILTELHRQRFGNQHPFVISGGHFSMLYARSLGIFYYPLLDPTIDSLEIRQAPSYAERAITAAKTTQFALESYRQCGDLYTTVVPVGPEEINCINIYHYPSDTLYSLLYALDSLVASPRFITRYYQNDAGADSPARTDVVGARLLQEYRSDLQRWLESYTARVFDPDTYLIRTDINISSTKDIGLQQSSFYDNVIFWATHGYAQELGLESQIDLDRLKTTILTTFWLEEPGHFLEDLSEYGRADQYYSSDWLIALSTGFLDPRDPEERVYYARSIEYIKLHQIDQPFPLRYHNELRHDRVVPTVRLVNPEYGNNGIWSFWGLEYIKALIILYQETGDAEYLNVALQHTLSFQTNIEQSGGFPEVYNSQGGVMDELFYRSVIKTGWVIGYEQVRALLRDAGVNDLAASPEMVE